jgi:Raf kinase inhibitor-like YbhB/YbcL family protein
VRRAALAAAAIAAAGCGGSAHHGTTTPTVTPPHLDTKPNLTSAFTPNGPIPSLYTCDGADKPLPLRWSTVPKGTRELVLVMRDPDAPIPDFVHWAVAGIPPSARQIPAGAIEGRNSLGTIGYRGPCPPRGDRPHHYVLTLSALSAPSGLTKPGFSADALRAPALGIYTLVGTYQRR